MLQLRKDKEKKNNGTRNSYDYSNYDQYLSGYDYDENLVDDDYDYNYDLDLAYEDYYSYDEQPRYVRPNEEPRYSSFRNGESGTHTHTSKKKKRKMSTSMKALVVVYFAIVTVIACLLIVNALPMMKADAAEGAISGMENIEEVSVDANAVSNVVLADGTVVTLAASEKVPYEYEINSNWFDDMCDWMENLVA